MFSKRRFTIGENNLFFGMCCFAPTSLVSAVSTWKFFLLYLSLRNTIAGNTKE